MPDAGPEDAVRVHAGRLRDGLHLLPDRDHGPGCGTSPPARSSTRCTRSTAAGRAGRGARTRGRSPTSCSWAWASRSHNFENLKAALQHPPAPRTGPTSRTATSPSPPSGLVPMIDRLGAETDVKLAISLNATTDEQRDELMPVNRRWNIAALMEACRAASRCRQGRRITFEYVLLARRQRHRRGRPSGWPSCSRHPGQGEPHPVQREPRAGLPPAHGPRRSRPSGRPGLARNLTAVVRKNRGRDISAACGQLAREGGPGDPRRKGARAALGPPTWT